MNYQERIISSPDVLLGKPVIKGSRISVELILRKMSHGATIGDILNSYPHITKEDVYAVLEYASAYIANEEILVPKR